MNIYRKESPDNYNGWSNYATWRVKLEVFDGDFYDEDSHYASIGEIADHLKEYAENIVELSLEDSNFSGLVAGWAHAFLNDVNWYEIAQSFIDDNPKLLEASHD